MREIGKTQWNDVSGGEDPLVLPPVKVPMPESPNADPIWKLLGMSATEYIYGSMGGESFHDAANAAVGASFGLSGDTFDSMMEVADKTVQENADKAAQEEYEKAVQEYLDTLHDLGLVCEMSETGFALMLGELGIAKGVAGQAGTVTGLVVEPDFDCP